MKGIILSAENKRKQKVSLEQFQAGLVELALRADCEDREDEWVRDMFPAHMNNEKIAENLLAQTRNPQDAYEHAIHQEKRIEHSRTIKNPFGCQTTITKQEPEHNVNTRGKNNQQNSQSNQRGRGGFRGRTYPRGKQNPRDLFSTCFSEIRQRRKNFCQIWVLTDLGELRKSI